MENFDLQQSISHLKFVLERSSNQILTDVFGWGSSHFRLLVTIAHSTETDQTDIAKELGQTKAAVSRQIKLLINEDLVSQTVNPKNRRQNQLKVTAKGRKQLIKAKQLMKNNFKKQFSSLDSDVIKRTVSLLNQIADKIETQDLEKINE